jgi:hypothetical protein
MPPYRKKRIALYFDPDPGITLKTIYDICIHAEANYPELKGIEPLPRVEAGLAIPFNHPKSFMAVYKMELQFNYRPVYWVREVSHPWKDSMPLHPMLNSGISFSSQGEDRANAFAHTFDEPAPLYRGKQRIFLECSRGNFGKSMTPRMFNALKNVLDDLGLCKKPAAPPLPSLSRRKKKRTSE